MTWLVSETSKDRATNSSWSNFRSWLYPTGLIVSCGAAIACVVLEHHGCPLHPSHRRRFTHEAGDSSKRNAGANRGEGSAHGELASAARAIWNSRSACGPNAHLLKWFFGDFPVIVHWLVCLQRREDPEAFRMGTLLKPGARRGVWWVGDRTASRRFSLRSAALVRWCWVGSPLAPVRVGGQTPA